MESDEIVKATAVSTAKPLRLAYLVTKFPLLSETFIYEELVSLREMGFDVRLLAFYHTGGCTHGYTRSLEDITFYAPPILSCVHLAAHWHWIYHCFSVYWSALIQILCETWHTPVILGKSLYAFCKGVALAHILDTQHTPPHHLHAHWATMPTTAAMVISQLLDIPFSFTAHAWDIFKEQAMLTAKLCAAEFGVTISEYNRQYLCQLCPTAADRIHVVRCGVNLARFPYRREYPPNGTLHILSVGRLVKKKGFPQLIAACAQMRQQGSDFVCTIVGDGPQRRSLEQLITACGLQDMVKLAGGLPHERLHDLWRMAYMFVLPCVVDQDGDRDGIPVVLMEAMASGVPVISTSVSGIPELVEDGTTGLLIPPNDADHLCQAIIRLLNDPPLAARLAYAGRRRVEQEHDVIQNTEVKASLFRA